MCFRLLCKLKSKVIYSPFGKAFAKSNGIYKNSGDLQQGNGKIWWSIC